MSIGNLKDSGNLGNNFPWQLKMLQGLQSIYDEVKKPLTCLEDSVSICSPLGGLNVNLHDGTGNPITSTPIGPDRGIDVNIIGGVTLEVNLDPDNDAVGMYGYTDINDPLNPTAILVNSAGQLDIRPLTCADEVSLCFNDGVSNVTVSSTNPLPVNAIVTVPNLTCQFDSVAICDFASGNSLVPNANGSVSSQTLDGTGNAITSTSFISGEQALDVNVVNNLDCSTDSVAICDGAGNALAIDSTGNINSNLYAQDAGTGLQQPVSLTSLGTANALDVYLQGPRGVQANCDDAISTALCQTQEDILTNIKTAVEGTLDVNIVTPNLAVSLGSLVVPAGVMGDLSAFGSNITSITFQNIGTAVATISVDGGSNFFPLAPGTVINLDPRVPMGYYSGVSFYWDTTTVGASLLIIYNYI